MAGVAFVNGAVKEFQDYIKAMETLGTQIDELRRLPQSPTKPTPVSTSVPTTTAPATAAGPTR